MTKILVVEDLPTTRIAIADGLHERGYRVSCVEDGEAALQWLINNTPQVIILDLFMPRMDGFTLLTIMRSTERWKGIPVIVLTSVADRDFVLRVSNLKVDAYMLKSNFSLPTLLITIEEILRRKVIGEAVETTRELKHQGPRAEKKLPIKVISAPSAIQQKIESTVDYDSRVQRIYDRALYKAPQGTRAEILSIADRGEPDVIQLSGLICGEQHLREQFLQIVNYEGYSNIKYEILTIHEAVRHLGVRAVCNIANEILLFQSLHRPMAEDGYVYQSWKHALATATIMSTLVPRCEDLIPERAHVIGLYHDISEILIREEFSDNYDQVLTRVEEDGLSLEKAEQEVLGLSRVTVAKTILSKMNLPPTIVEPIEEHLESHSAAYPRKVGRMTSILNISDDIATTMHYAHSVACTLRTALKVELEDAFDNTHPWAIEISGIGAKIDKINQAITSLQVMHADQRES